MAANIYDVYRRLSVLFLTTVDGGLGVSEGIRESARNILEHFEFSLVNSPVTGVALKYEKELDDLSVVIFLREPVEGFAEFVKKVLGLGKFPISELTTGEIHPTSQPLPTKRSPAIGGDSLGEGVEWGQSGTFGCLVEDSVGEKFLLSCNHVLSEINAGIKGVTMVWQPSDRAGGCGADEIGMLHDYKEVLFGEGKQNLIDAATAKPFQPYYAREGIKALGSINGTALNIPIGLKVEKYGWRTDDTVGTFLYLVNFLNPYPGRGKALFVDQLGIVGESGKFSDNGDSGSLVVNENRQAVGLVFADASDLEMTFANQIGEVFRYFGVSPA